MPTRTARTAWDGGIQDGSGEVELSSSGLGTFEMSFPKRSSEDGGGTTNPEELIAAAHSACYSMQLSALLGERGATPITLQTSADVTLGPDPAGGFRITAIALRVRGEVDGIDENGFLEAAEEAKDTCPVSKALEGVDEMTLDAALETA
ncbi:OsmC family peroxiredoxin [Aeromicrobium phragmitis]|uniref:OsmC family peroxiredoxin n=2 Tax=Aeromicrobium phragmitis TaxID=2478914 RepID=A0A3L8PNS3_9ACTN|nr:OsmC family peroxiredoxin [Aeromicrobium phragmitis]